MHRFLFLMCQHKNEFMRPVILICIALMLVQTSCRKTSADENGQLKLNNCIERKFSGEKVNLCFDSLLSESRCPVNARCIWQGYALAKFIFKEGAQQHEVILSTVSMQGIPSQDTTISGYTIRLVDIHPYPGNTPAPVTASIEITH
jgi:hypothetical protein